MTRLPAAVAAAALSLVFQTARAENRRLTVEDAIHLASQQNSRLLAGRERATAAHDAALSVGGRMLASVHLSEEFQYYDSPFDIAFGPNKFRARDQDTNTFVAAADQPVLGLLHISQDYLAQRDNSRAAEAQVDAGEARLREAVQTGFLRVFEARALEEVAKASEGQLKQQYDEAQVKLKAGVFTNADVLRVRTAWANAQQQEIVARTQAITARANLLVALGLPADDPVELVEPKDLLAQARSPRPSFADARDQALRRRPEMRQLSLLESAAGHNTWARTFSLLPEVDFEMAYLRIDGQLFVPTDQEYIGFKASWPIWEWGASFFQQRAAAHQHSAARLDLDEQKTEVAAEVSIDLANAEAAASAVAVAQEAITSAEEAYRVTTALVGAGAATTTDLLDAQSALTQARANLTRAQYELAVARVALTRATGG